MLGSGDRVVYCATKGPEVEPEQRGKLLAMVELTRITANTLDYPGTPRAIDFNEAGEFRWPFALTLAQAWKFDPEVSLDQVRDECLNEHLFFSMNHARAVVAGWVEDFNTARPHSAIGYMTPAAYAATLKPQRAPALRHLKSSAPPPVATAAPRRNSQPTNSSRRWMSDRSHVRRTTLRAPSRSSGAPPARAWAMEKALLRRLDTFRSRQNHEVLVGIALKKLEATWHGTLVHQRRQPVRIAAERLERPVPADPQGSLGCLPGPARPHPASGRVGTPQPAVDCGTQSQHGTYGDVTVTSSVTPGELS